MASPDKNAGGAKSSLRPRAPLKPIPTRTWHMQVHSFGANFEYKNVLEQNNQCIRSMRASISRDTGSHLVWQAGSERELPTTAGVPIGATVSRESRESSQEDTIGYPYPEKYQKLLEEPEELTIDTTPAQEPPAEKEESYNTGFYLDWGSLKFKIWYTSAIKYEIRPRPIYIVLGLFHRGDPNPHERIAFVHEPEHLRRELHWATFRLRGLRGSLLSLRYVKHLGLYKIIWCDAKTGTHERVNLDDNGITDLKLFLQMYKSWHVRTPVAAEWMEWVYNTVNEGSREVDKGTYGIELVLGWSVTRITVVVLLPVLLSLSIGLWLNSSSWTDLATIQTAWGTASYVVTAGGLLAALLGILSSIDS